VTATSADPWRNIAISLMSQNCGIQCGPMGNLGALPSFLKIWWLCASPLAVLFAGRFLWEKTIWTWSRGPQMVGFALWHIHPGVAVVGTLSSATVALWLLIAIPFAIVRRRDLEPPDWLMMGCSVLVIVAVALPDNFFA
jgi:hypothetical protein